MRNYLFLVSFSLFSLLFWLPQIAFSQNCPNQQAHFNVNIVTKPVIYDTDHNIQYISSLIGHKKNSFTQLNPTFYTVGLTMPKKTASVSFLMQPGKTNDKMFCGKIVSLDFNLSLETVVYISSELKDLTCSYNRIVNHENTHVNIEQKALAKLQKNIGSLLLANFDTVLYAPTMTQLREMFEQRRSELLDNVYKKLKEDTDPMHEAIDTKENYLKESATCPLAEKQELYKRKSYSIYK